MPDIAAALKAEITRLAKKSVRQSIGPLQSASATHRRQIARLRKQIVTLERELTRLRRKAAAAPAAKDESDEGGAGVRFVAKGLRPLRTRLGLSAEEFGLLIGVSPQSVYNWEQRKARPRQAQIVAIAALRGVGKREARARLDELAAKTSRPKARKQKAAA